MWHELVLHGIGGRTIAEAKETMSHVEFKAWVSYLTKRGTLNQGTKLEGGFALIAHLICSAAGIKHKSGRAMQMADFMPHAETEEPLSVDKVFKALGGKRG